MSRAWRPSSPPDKEQLFSFCTPDSSSFPYFSVDDLILHSETSGVSDKMRLSGVLLVLSATLCSAQKQKAEWDHRSEGELSWKHRPCVFSLFSLKHTRWQKLVVFSSGSLTCSGEDKQQRMFEPHAGFRQLEVRHHDSGQGSAAARPQHRAARLWKVRTSLLFIQRSEVRNWTETERWF